jgi:hypothetical protein
MDMHIRLLGRRRFDKPTPQEIASVSIVRGIRATEKQAEAALATASGVSYDRKYDILNGTNSVLMDHCNNEKVA